MNTVVKTQGLVKSFGNKQVLQELDFAVNEGSVIGILGNNGAGKTTLLKTLMGQYNANLGTSLIFNEDSNNLSIECKDKIGYVSQEADLLPWMTAHQIISYTKSFYTQWDDELTNRLLNDWKINSKEVIEDMSVGQKQKLSIILALAHKPELLILDEPVASLDPLARREFIKELIDINLDFNNTIIFSTHITSDLERVAAEIMILKEGKNYFQGDIDTLKENIARIHIQCNDQVPETLPLAKVLKEQRSGKQIKVTVENLTELNISELEQSLNASLRIEQMSLEDIFVECHQ
ncbi:ABC transporter ATP-binding protein [Pleionea sp. CnH1-48]|uniref:ABC transporter ATP-binding protein n=1 Tax=Pleionea sp. CnH1-48 TaxID=2954494 RepID=UPI0020983123|nr:ABC transporter ATP-binding protein [Pleionea sp. CnH1-48]MCO7226670.1 ABC transporter ATP-binding protein [Pleionea sp. CnH1-48]